MKQSDKKVLLCKECGSSPVPHAITYTSIVVDGIFRSVFSSDEGLHRIFIEKINRLINSFEPKLYRASARLGMSSFIDRPDDKTFLIGHVLWEEAERRGIQMQEFRPGGLPRNLFIAKLKDGRNISFQGIPVPSHTTQHVSWTDNKAILKERFTELGFPVAKGDRAFTETRALKIFSELSKPVIVKPHIGSSSRHTTLHINTAEDLVRAFLIAKQVSPFALIEEELVGPVYRATVVDGRFRAALRRDQPHVFGDGKHTIRELIEDANKHPKRGGPYFSKISITPDTEAELLNQNYELTSIPEKGIRVTLHQKVNWSLGGTTADVTNETHEDNIKLFEGVARALKASTVGIDFIIRDIKNSWKDEPRSGIIECNSMPFFDNHHLPFEGEPQNVAGAIWEMYE